MEWHSIVFDIQSRLTYLMDPNKTLYIHIGTGKTGTSAIQKFIESNESILRTQYDLSYITTGRSNSKHRSLDFNARRKLDNYTSVVCKLLESTKSEILKSSCHNHLISDEDFPGLTQEEIDLISEIFSPLIEIRIIVYLRRQDEYVESWYSQIVKTGAYTADINNLFERLSSGNLLDYAAMLQPWENTFGKDNIFVKPYEPIQFKHNSIFNDFLSVVGIDATGLQTPAKEINTSLSRDKILLLNKLGRNGLEYLIDNNFIEHLKTIRTKGDSKFVLSSEKRQKIVNSYLDSNGSVSRKYYNDRELFIAPPPLESELTWNPRSEVPDKIFLEMLRYVGAMDN